MSLSAEDKKEPVLGGTPELILKGAVLRSNKLDVEAQEAVSQKDAATGRQKFAERARLIADLPERVRQAMKRGQSFSEEGLYQLEVFSVLANRALKDGRTFGLSVILKPDRGSLESGPNLLEELVNKLYPPKS